MPTDQTVLRPKASARIGAYLLVSMPLIFISVAALWQASKGSGMATADVGAVFGPSALVAVVGVSILSYLFRRQTYWIRDGKLISLGWLLLPRSLSLELIDTAQLANMQGHPNPRGAFLMLKERGTDRLVLVNTAIHDIPLWERTLDKLGIEFVG